MTLSFPNTPRHFVAAFSLLGLVLLVAAGDAAARQSGPDAVRRSDPDNAVMEQLNLVVFFDTDSAEVPRYAEPRLDAQARWLLRSPSLAVRIEGNTDERGSPEYNLALGARRAAAVREYLISRGVAPDRIDMISFGEDHPIALGLSDDALARNRNVSIVIIMPNVSR